MGGLGIVVLLSVIFVVIEDVDFFIDWVGCVVVIVGVECDSEDEVFVIVLKIEIEWWFFFWGRRGNGCCYCKLLGELVCFVRGGWCGMKLLLISGIGVVGCVGFVILYLYFVGLCYGLR